MKDLCCSLLIAAVFLCQTNLSESTVGGTRSRRHRSFTTAMHKHNCQLKSHAYFAKLSNRHLTDFEDRSLLLLPETCDYVNVCRRLQKRCIQEFDRSMDSHLSGHSAGPEYKKLFRSRIGDLLQWRLSEAHAEEGHRKQIQRRRIMRLIQRKIYEFTIRLITIAVNIYIQKQNKRPVAVSVLPLL